jgi:hypothetical protein
MDWFRVAPLIIAILLLRLALGGSSFLRHRSAPARAKEPRLPLGVTFPARRLVIWIAAPSMFAAAADAWSPGRPFVTITLGLTGLVLLCPWQITKRVLIPAGAPRLAYWVMSAANWPFSEDREGARALAAACALHQKSVVEEAQLEWLQQRVECLPELRGAGIVAAGLLAARRGRLEQARRLLRGIGAMHWTASPRAARRMAFDWLLCDAIRRDDRAAVEQLAASKLPRSAAARLLTALCAPAAARFSDLSLALWWLLAGSRFRTLPAMRAAFAGKRVHRPPSAKASQAQCPSATERAVLLHVELTRRDRVTARQLRIACHRWAAALRSWTTRARAHAAVQAGIVELGSLRERVENDVSQALAALCVRSGICVAPFYDADLPLLQIVASRAEQMATERVELLARALDLRLQSGGLLDPLAEWEQWLAIRGAYRHARRIGGPATRAALFQDLHHPANGLVCALNNDQQQKALANAICWWLWREARAVGDEEASALEHGNVVATAVA